MTDLAIRIEGLGKAYRLGGASNSHERLGEHLVDLVKRPLQLVRGLSHRGGASTRPVRENFWALKDITLDIRHGERIGIIGHNGAGKSTLLKILSGITEPTVGYADLYGRIGSLLEVGTGFHPDLTGRENIFLNGAILGMAKREIERKLDEIVAFAEVEEFIDTPVKNYSSGMYVRLAFAVAAHLDVDILVVDEVLAVGDLEFQRKCLGKMDDVATSGRTVLFVSHNLGLVETLCQRSILMEGGTVVADGSTTDVVRSYLQALESKATIDVSDRVDRLGSGLVKLIGVEVGGADGSQVGLKTGWPARFRFTFNSRIPGMACRFQIYDHLGQPVSLFLSEFRGPDDREVCDSAEVFVCDVDQLLLTPGRYRLDAGAIGENELQDFVRAACYFDVADGHIGGRPIYADPRFSVALPHRWTVPSRRRNNG